MEEDTEYTKLPLEERCVHKLWKARLHGYEEAIKFFRQLDDDKSPEFAKFLGLAKKFVTDSNAIAQEKGLEAVLAYVECYSAAGKTVGEVMAGIVSKCIAAPKTKTKDLSIQITLVFIELEKQEVVQAELLKGMEAKNPKIVSACVSAITLALREFGAKVINIKPLVKKMPLLLEDRDKAVREEGKAMVIEIFRWIGSALRPQLTSLKPVQVTELEAEFDKVKGEKVVPTRYLRSQQQRQAEVAAEEAESGEAMDCTDEGDGEKIDIDPYDLMDPVDILSKLPKDFYEKLEAKKWQERKEAVDLLEQLSQTPKLENGDYGDLIRALKKVISKDTNVMVVAVACKCLAFLARGLKKKFQPYACACIPSLLEKFREKKQNVVLALRDAADAVYLSTNIEAIQEDVVAALENKNPQVKAETASFLGRCFTRCTSVMLNKKLLKAYASSLIKTLNEPDPNVRDSAAEALGVALKVVGEKGMAPYITDLDNNKVTKIRECCEKAILLVKPAKAERPATAPPRVEAAGSAAPKPVRRPANASKPKKLVGSKKPVTTAPTAIAKSKSTSKMERDLSSEEVDEKAADLLPSEVLTGLGDTNWKTRLAAVEQFVQVVNTMEPSNIPTQVLIRTLNKKPGLKDTNFQALKARLEAVKMLAEVAPFSSNLLDYCLTDVAEKLGDPKNGTLAADTLMSLTAATKLDIVVTEVLGFAFSLKSPKVQQESLNWVGNAIKEFGFTLQPKPLIDSVKKGVLATQPAVRTAGISLLGILYLYMGQQLIMFFDNEKPALQQQILAEFEKHAGESPPAPIRGKVASKRSFDEDDNEDDDGEEQNVAELNLQDIMPRIDIGPQLTESFIAELADKNWKVRNEALQKLATMLNENKCITNNLGDLPLVLAKRLVDSNGKIAQTALTICQQLAEAMGAQCKVHVRTLFPGFLQSLGDSKTFVRGAAISCINAWGDQCGYKEFFTGEMVFEALKAGNPTLRVELWTWLSAKLPNMAVKSIPKEELLICLPILYSNLEDRSADVRKNAQEAVLPVMIHLGYENMLKATEKLPASSRGIVVGMLDKARPSLPARPSAKKPAAAGSEEPESKAVRGGAVKAGGKIPAKSKVAAGSMAVVKPGTRKKDEDADTSPLLQNNNLKLQRSIDETKSKVLRWTFTTPREEFVELLKDQMSVANFSKTLMANMFHADFKYHLKAIESLSEDLPLNPAATQANLDLILKWMTLRFFDTNPSVLLKGLEYLQSVFTMLIDKQYNLFETEAQSFIPYLILKIGDPKDAVRNGVKQLLNQIERVFPVTKLFSFVIEALKSKNARQRSECLDQLGALISSYGVCVCQPSVSAAMKEVARQISDRDNSVRNAALNCIVQAFFQEGDKIYKMLGSISDKDLSLLEERIRRAIKNRPPQRTVSAPAPPIKQAQLSPNSPQQQRVAAAGDEFQDEPQQGLPSPPLRTSPPRPRPVSGPFGLDQAFLEGIEGHTINISAPKLNEFDFSEILSDKPIDIPNTANLIGSGNTSLSSPPHAFQHPAKEHSPRLVECSISTVIANLSHLNMETAIEAASQIDAFLLTDNATMFIDKADPFVIACVMQLKFLNASNRLTTPAEQLCRAYRVLFMVMLTFYGREELPLHVSKQVLRSQVEQLLGLLEDQRMEEFEGNDSFIRVINMIVLKIIEKADHTTVTCALIELLNHCVGSRLCSSRLLELVMKCTWKLIRLLPSWDHSTMDFSMILYDIHLFLKAYPSSMWKSRPSDTPVRTIKTILHSLVKIMGSDLLLHLGRIENPGESELQSYLHKLVKQVQQDDQKISQPKRETKVQNRLSKSTHQLLSEIFKKIGSKDQTKEGLASLYDFREQHPEADIEPFLKKSSRFFQDYIRRGLESIDAERRMAGRICTPMVTSTSSMSSGGILESGPSLTPSGSSDAGDTNIEDRLARVNQESDDEALANIGSKNALYYLERLRSLQISAGINPAAEILEVQENRVVENDNIICDDNINKHDKEKMVSIPRTNMSSTTGSDVEHLRKRLEALKSK